VVGHQAYLEGTFVGDESGGWHPSSSLRPTDQRTKRG
jgi:hypothetical protein